jgi:hypothetical protein
LLLFSAPVAAKAATPGLRSPATAVEPIEPAGPADFSSLRHEYAF